MASRRSRNEVLHLLYLIGIVLKGIDGVLETIGGLVLLLVTNAALSRLVLHLSHQEYVGGPSDWIAAHLRQALGRLASNHRLFAGAYLLGHGAVKMFLVWGLLRCKLWAFPTSLVLVGAFVVYQSSRLIHRFSISLLVLTVIDCVVLSLIWREYRMMKSGRAPPCRHQPAG